MHMEWNSPGGAVFFLLTKASYRRYGAAGRVMCQCLFRKSSKMPTSTGGKFSSRTLNGNGCGTLAISCRKPLCPANTYFPFFSCRIQRFTDLGTLAGKYKHYDERDGARETPLRGVRLQGMLVQPGIASIGTASLREWPITPDLGSDTL